MLKAIFFGNRALTKAFNAMLLLGPRTQKFIILLHFALHPMQMPSSFNTSCTLLGKPFLKKDIHVFCFVFAL